MISLTHAVFFNFFLQNIACIRVGVRAAMPTREIANRGAKTKSAVDTAYTFYKMIVSVENIRLLSNTYSGLNWSASVKLP